jgi:hypothetical protein
MAQPEDMIPMQMAKELAKVHAADLRRVAAPRLTTRRPHLRNFASGWAVLRRHAGSLRRPRLVGGPTCAG